MVVVDIEIGSEHHTIITERLYGMKLHGMPAVGDLIKDPSSTSSWKVLQITWHLVVEGLDSHDPVATLRVQYA